MAKAKPKRAKRTSRPAKRSTRRWKWSRYSPTELFLAAVGAALLVLLGGIVLVSILGN